MNRAEFFRGVLALIGLQYAPAKSYPYKMEPLKPGEERCPLGHVQKPQVNWDLGESQIKENGFVVRTYSSWPPLRACSVCGIVYVEQKP